MARTSSSTPAAAATTSNGRAPRSDTEGLQVKTRRFLGAASALVLTAAATAVSIALSPGQATAATNDFRGFNWADQRDNFVADTLVLGGLSTSDSYATTVAKATSVLNSATANLSTNTVRIPVNYPTISGSYWNSYRGIIDAA